MTTDSPKFLRVPLTGARPVRVREDQWPVIAEGVYAYWDGQYRSQASRTTDMTITVRQHADGRALVYGRYTYWSAWQGDRGYTYYAGYVIQPGSDIVDALRMVASDLIDQGVERELAMEIMRSAIAGLPEQDI